MYFLRIAVVEDLPELQEMEQGLISVERTMDPTIKEGKISYYDIAALIEAPDAEVYVIEYEKKIVASGYARIKGDRHYLKHKNQGYLGFMFVKEAHRGKGLNQLIIDSLIKWCESQGVYEIRLDVYETNPSAIRAYEKAGFKKHMVTMRFNSKDQS